VSGVTGISTSDYLGASMVQKADGTVWTWGDNLFGELGNGTEAGSPGYSKIPVQAVGLSTVTAVSSGPTHSMARRSDSTIWNWGENAWNELGDGTTLDTR